MRAFSDDVSSIQTITLGHGLVLSLALIQIPLLTGYYFRLSAYMIWQLWKVRLRKKDDLLTLSLSDVTVGFSSAELVLGFFILLVLCSGLCNLMWYKAHSHYGGNSATTAFYYMLMYFLSLSLHLMAIFKVNLGQLVPECLHSGFYWSQGWWMWWWQPELYDVPLHQSSRRHQHPVFLQAGCPSCRPTDSVKALCWCTGVTNCSCTVGLWSRRSEDSLVRSEGQRGLLSCCTFADTISLSVCLSVCLSVWLSASGTTQKVLVRVSW